MELIIIGIIIALYGLLKGNGIWGFIILVIILGLICN